MVIDTSDNTIGICEGMVWVDMESVADRIPTKERSKVIDWLLENISQWDEEVMDAIVDFATDKVAEIARDNA